jgi:hypothetical protein
MEGISASVMNEEELLREDAGTSTPASSMASVAVKDAFSVYRETAEKMDETTEGGDDSGFTTPSSNIQLAKSKGKTSVKTKVCGMACLIIIKGNPLLINL